MYNSIFKEVISSESETFQCANEFLLSHGVEAVDLALEECVEMMQDFIQEKPALWNEDIDEE